MKRLFTALFLITVLSLCGSTDAWAQFLVFNGGTSAYNGAPNVPHIFMFESMEADTLFFGSYGMSPEDDTDRNYGYWIPWAGATQEGTGALMLDWGLFTEADWGGSSALQHVLPDTTLRLYDFSDFTHINLWYNTQVPAEPSATFRLKLQDASEGLVATMEDWYSESVDVYQAQPGWNLYSIPLENLGTVGPSSGGFSRPGCPDGCWSGIWGNGELDLDKIAGFQLEITGPQYGAANDSSTAGTIVFDNFNVSGVRYNTVESFDDSAMLSNWQNSNAGSYTLVAAADTTEGTGSIQVDYNLVGDQGWGGSVDIEGSATGEYYDDMQARTHLSLFYKVLTPASAPESMNITFKLFENSSGPLEEWHWSTTTVLGDESGQWRRLLIPFSELAIPSWMSEKGDELLFQNKITKFQIQIFINEGASSAGSILFDRLTGYGIQETDFEAPDAVMGFDIATSTYNNIVSWEDVPGEESEVYDIFFSPEMITDVNAPGVMVAAQNVARGNEVFIHPIYAPVNDQQLNYYYAITATDGADNVSDPTVIGPFSNMAKGLATIAMSAPAGFAADGDISEWAGMTPINVDPTGDLGHVPTAYTVNDANDLSANVYLALDAEALYVAFEVTDEAYNPVPEGVTDERWLYDGTELYIGLYDWRGRKHANYGGTTEPDYKFYFYTNVVRTDGAGDLYTDADENYSFTRTATGYVVEAKLPYDTFKFDAAPVFEPKNGMRLPLDFVIMDNDIGGSTREGLMAYSFGNDDNSWQSPTNWFYTWIGDQIDVGVEAISTEVPRTYALHQNYPNPFNPATIITYDLKLAGQVDLKVFNILGQEVVSLVDALQNAGTYEVRFDATNLPSGVYFYQIRSGNFVQTQKMMLIR